MQYAIGMDFGGTNMRAALIDSKSKIIRKITHSSENGRTPKLFVSKVSEMVQRLIAQEGLKKSNIVGMGIGVPGPCDSKKGMVYSLTNLPAWKNVPLGILLKKRLGIPVALNNDGNAMAQGEFLFGAAKGSSNAVFLTLGTGIGGGILIDGRLVHGSTFSACEIGHMHFKGGSKKCACPSSGCIETAVGNKYLLKKANKTFKSKTNLVKRIAKKKNSKKIQLEHITAAARKGDVKAIQFWEDIGVVLGEFLAGICNLLNPDTIVIGGGVMGAGGLITNPLKKAITQNAFPIAYKKLKIRKAKFGNESGLVGSASLVFTGVL